MFFGGIQYAAEHLRLVAHIKRLDLGPQLGYDSLDAMLDAVGRGVAR